MKRRNQGVEVSGSNPDRLWAGQHHPGVPWVILHRYWEGIGPGRTGSASSYGTDLAPAPYG